MLDQRKIDAYVPKAIDILAAELEGSGAIVKNGKIKKTFQGQIATFGVAVSMGSILSAVAFYSNEGEATVERPALMEAIYKIIKGEEAATDGENKEGNKRLFAYVKNEFDNGGENSLVKAKLKNEILSAAVALKLAMNFYEFEKE